jgi:tetratricopeptide (TPR) repeat protein
MRKLGTSLLVVCTLTVGGWSLQQTPAPTPQPAPAGKRPPQAKSQAEYKDYNTAYATTGGAAMEKAADDFSARYPQSELRSYLYSKALHQYQNENQPGKMLAMGEKALGLDPDNPIALVLTATVLSDSLSDSDPDRQQKVAEIKKNASRALETVDTSFTPPANATPEQVTAYKNTLLSMAHSAIGITDLKMSDDTGAEKELQTAAELIKTQPDPYIWYHLALSQDHQNKYAAALESVNQALRYTTSNPDLDKLAHGERDRLMKLTGTQPAQPNNSQPPHK